MIQILKVIIKLNLNEMYALHNLIIFQDIIDQFEKLIFEENVECKIFKNYIIKINLL